MKYASLVEVYEKLEATTKRLDKTYFISELLANSEESDLQQIVLLLEGRIFPTWDEREIGVASQLVLKAISTATGIQSSDVEREWKKTGDLGLVAENLIAKKKQNTLFSKELTVTKVFDNLRKVAQMEGTGSVDRKVQAISELLTSAKPKEAKYIIRTIIGELRVGAGAGAMRDGIAQAFFPKVIGIFFKCKNCSSVVQGAKCPKCSTSIETKFSDEIKRNEKNVLDVRSADELSKKNVKEYEFVRCTEEKIARECYMYFIEHVQRAYDAANDFGEVAVAAKQGISALENIGVAVGKPIKVMLAIKAKDIEEGFETVGKPADIEYKYDGFRMQIHKIDNKITLFTRRLENVTMQFPEVAAIVKQQVKGDSFILDSEAVGYDPKTKKYRPFQDISQRIKRKYDIEETGKDLPVELNIFDVIYYNGKTMLSTPLEKRQELMRKIITPLENKIVPVTQIKTDNLKTAEEFYKKSLAAGNEGIMMKALSSPYKPGARVGYMVKIKPIMETLDLVIAGAEWGEGKRTRWLSSFTLACIDKDGKYLEIGKVGTGIKEKEEQGVSFEQLTNLLKPYIISEKGKEAKIKPEIIVEIAYEEIQKSPTYSSGYALRFPRVIRIRDDRRPDEASDLALVEHLYREQ